MIENPALAQKISQNLDHQIPSAAYRLSLNELGKLR